VVLAFKLDGLHVAGKYPTRIPIIGDVSLSFGSTWVVSVENTKLAIKLAGISVTRIPIGILKGVIFAVLERISKDNPGITVENSTVFVDLDIVLCAQGYNVKTNLASITMSEGECLLECKANATNGDRSD
jgi:hypothetical protein